MPSVIELLEAQGNLVQVQGNLVEAQGKLVQVVQGKLVEATNKIRSLETRIQELWKRKIMLYQFSTGKSKAGKRTFKHRI